MHYGVQDPTVKSGEIKKDLTVENPYYTIELND